MLRDKRKSWVTIAVAVILCLGLIGSSFVGFGLALLDTDSSDPVNTVEILQQEYEARRATVEQLESRVVTEPGNMDLQLVLAEAYVDKATIALQIAPGEAQADLEKAIAGYQVYLSAQTEHLPEVLNALANAAQLAGQNTLAEQTYSETLAQDPENVEALYGYGVLLFYALEEKEKAIAQWEKGAAVATDPQIRQAFDDQLVSTRDSIGKE